ncbi:MAG TPA: hypothetical protein PKD70_11270 [Saprospiraceae bacterium]|nr:hypothetical protein [Saprospiraceae bacterium]HMP14452.1 hypothetical protein [Saprospiraceae bacterium]
MIKEGMLTNTKDERWIHQMLSKVIRPRGYEQIRANAEGYELPAALSRKDGEIAYIPDATAVLHGRKCYFELALKTERVREVASKWKLMSMLAAAREGQFFIVAPRGHVAFAEKILKQHHILAAVVRI